ncbi:MAG: GGDEF domain-containing protein [Syntrophobacteraceae bacterium]
MFPRKRRAHMENVERLSEIVIEALKELSAEQKMLSTASLCQVFAMKEELLQLLALPAASSKGLKIQGVTPEQQISDLKNDIRGLRVREERLHKETADLEALNSQWRDFSKQSILALLVMVRPDSKTLSDSMELFRLSVLNDADLETQRECLKKIKSSVLREVPPASGTGKSLSDPATSREGFAWKAEAPEQAATRLEQLQECFVKILDQLDSVSDEVKGASLDEIRQTLMKCDSDETLVACGEDILNAARAYLVQITDERAQMAKFIQDLGKSLIGMEEQFISSISDNKETYSANEEFNAALNGHMDDIRESFGFGKTLDETLGFVSSKLETIKAALRNKKKDDELRFANANKRLDDLQKRLQSMKSEINRVQKRTKALEHEILLDSMTGIHNRRAYELRIAEELNRYRRYKQSFSLVLFDVDNFKSINDQFGHSAGDKCLREIINRVKPCIRNTDFLARYGGEEFVILFIGTPKENACKAAEKIRGIIEKTRFHYDKKIIPVTISLGVTDIRSTDADSETIFARADTAMYEAKREGRNLVRMV